MGSCQPASRASGASPSRRSVLGSSDCCTDGAPARMPPGSRRHRLVKAADRLERDAGSAEAEIAVEPGAELPGMTADVDAELIRCLVINGCKAVKISTSLVLPPIATAAISGRLETASSRTLRSIASCLSLSPNEMSERASLDWMRASILRFTPRTSFVRNQSCLNPRIDHALTEAVPAPFQKLQHASGEERGPFQPRPRFPRVHDHPVGASTNHTVTIEGREREPIRFNRMVTERAPDIDAFGAGRLRADEEFRLFTSPKLLAVHAEAWFKYTDTFDERSAHCKIRPERLRIGERHGSHVGAYVIPSKHAIHQIQALALEPARAPLFPERNDATGGKARFGKCVERFCVGPEPVPFQQDIVVGEDNPSAARDGQRPVSRIGKTLRLLDHAPDRQPRRGGRDNIRCIVGAVVVDDDHLDICPVDADL